MAKPAAQSGPEAKSLASWEDAFQHPLPAIHRLAKSVRAHADEDGAKLRTLVGARYRDLLGTAERIVAMDEQARHAEDLLGAIGQKCSARALEHVTENHGRMKRAREDDDQKGVVPGRKKRMLAQMKVLQSAVMVSTRMIRSGGDALLVAKLLVLARLLHRSVSEMEMAESDVSQKMLEELRRKLNQARKKLLTYIGRSLGRANVEKDSIVRSLCAYALISSAAPKDVLRYFLQVRFEQLVARDDMPSETDLLNMLDLYSQTLLDTREVFPRRCTELLSQLSQNPLVQDKQVRSVFELSLDIYEQWIPDDVRNFRPWVRHDQLSASDVGDALSSWTVQAQRCLVESLTDSLAEQSDARTVLNVRQKLISKYISLGSRLKDEIHRRAIDEIRGKFRDKLENLAARSAEVPGFELDVRPPSQSRLDHTIQSIWDLSIDSHRLDRGAQYLRQAVLQRQNGRVGSIENVISALDDWESKLENFEGIIKSMRAAKWDEEIDLDLDELEDGELYQSKLSKDEPEQVFKRLQQETVKALKDTYSRVEQASKSENEAAFLIRVVREIDQRRRILIDRLPELENMAADKTLLATLHQRIVVAVGEVPLEHFVESTRNKAYVAVSLWDGTPPLPIQPSVGTFKFLTELQQSMSDAGNDLWSAEAVRVLKSSLSSKLSQQLQDTLLSGGDDDGDAEESESGDENQNGETSASHQTTHNRKLQHLFDVLYIQCLLAVGGASDQPEPLKALVQSLTQGVNLDSASQEQLKKSAAESWKRTYLLFGLLACGQTT